MPGADFLDGCPAKVRGTILAVLDAVAAAPPPAFSGGGKWEAMHGDMGGYYEIRVTGPGREQFRLFCVLENADERTLTARGLRGPAIAVISTVPTWPEGAATPDLPAASEGSDRPAGPLDRVGTAMSPTVVREARKDDHRQAPGDPRSDRTRTLKRTDRGGEHHHPPDRPPRLQLPHPRRTHRSRQAQTLRTQPTTPRTSHITDKNVRRVANDTPRIAIRV